MNQSRLTPQEQSLLFQLSQKAGTKPTQAGAPITQEDPQAQEGLSSLAPQRGVGELPPPSGNMSPEEFMRTIAPHIASQGAPKASANYAQKIVKTKDGGLGIRVPSEQPILNLLGVKRTQKIDPTNYYDTIVDLIGEGPAKALLPGNTPVQPDGKPFVSENLLEKLDGFIKVPRKSEQDKPNPALGKLTLSKLENAYGKDSPQYQNAKEYLDSMGGLSLSKFGEFTNTAMKEETPNFIKGANGLMQRFNRAKNSYESVPGQTTGVLEILGDPASKSMFDTKLQDFQSDPVVKSLKTQLDNLGNASAILETDNPASVGVFFSNVAKSIGKEAGVLTEGDIQRSVGDPGIAAQLYRWYNKKADIFNGKGQFSEKDLKDFRGLIRDLGTAADKRYEMALNRHVGSVVKTIPGLTPEFVKGAFDTSNRFIPSEERRLPGQATGYKTEMKPKSDPLGLFK